MRPGCVPVQGPATDTLQSYEELCVAQRKLFTLALHNQGAGLAALQGE